MRYTNGRILSVKRQSPTVAIHLIIVIVAGFASRLQRTNKYVAIVRTSNSFR